MRDEIATYAGWSKSEIAIHGIYFDKTPAEDVGDARTYLKNISAAVRHEGFLEPRLVVHNPGTVPNVNLTSYPADVTVVFEGEYKNMPKKEEMRAKLQALEHRREDYAYLVHSTPENISRGALRRIINGVRRDVEWLFVTDGAGDGKYDGYGSRWEEFLSLMW